MHMHLELKSQRDSPGQQHDIPKVLAAGRLILCSRLCGRYVIEKNIRVVLAKLGYLSCNSGLCELS